MSDTTKPCRIHICGGSTCAKRGSRRLRRVLEDALWERDLTNSVEVMVTNCQDNCDYAPNMTVQPGSFQYAQLTPQAIEQIVEQHIQQSQPVQNLLHNRIGLRYGKGKKRR